MSIDRSKPLESGHAPVNGIYMYYEVHGLGDGVPDDEVRTVRAPTLIVLGDQDVVTPEHGLELARLIPGARLLVLPGGHGDYLGELVTTQEETAYPELTAELISEFLDA